MRKRPKQKSSDKRQPTMLESLELRRLLSVAPFSSMSLASVNSSLSATVNWVPAVTASANLTAAPDGSLWYIAGNSVEHYTPGGLTAAITLLSANGAPATISALAVTADGSAWFAMDRGTGSDVFRVVSKIAVLDTSSEGPIGKLAAAGNQLWATVGSDTIEELGTGSDPISIHVSGVTAFTGLTVDGQGNAWFSASTAEGEGLIGKVTAGGEITTFNVDAQPGDIAASNGRIFFSDHNAIWRVAADGTMSKTALSGTPAKLTAAADGSVWFIDASNASYPLGHFGADGSVMRYSIAPQTGLNSLAITPDGTLWIMASGALGAWHLHASNLDSTITIAGNISNAVFSAGFYGNISAAMTVETRGSLGSFVLSTGGTTVVTNAVDTSTATTTTTDSQSTTTAPATPATGPSSNDTTEHTAGAAIAVNSNSAPRQATGDPGAFEGEFAVTGRQAIPDRDKRFGQSHLQSNAGAGGKAIATASGTHAAGVADDGARASAELTVLARLADEGDAASPVTMAAGNSGGDKPGVGEVVVAQITGASGGAGPAVAATGGSNVEEAGVPASDVSRWWKLAVYMSSAAGIEVGRGGQRYFRV